MTKLGELARTVQYFRLIDAASGSPVPEYDWQQLLAKMNGAPLKKNFDRKDLTGNVRLVDVPAIAKTFVPPTDLQNVIHPPIPDKSYGLVISTPKDHVPTQGHKTTGDHKPVGIDADYEPINTLFVWFLPYGNLFGLMQESTSAANARLFAGWITTVMRDLGLLNGRPDFQYAAAPLIDPARHNEIKKADSFKRLVFSGETQQGKKNGVFDVFFGGHKPKGAYRIEVSIKPVYAQNKYYEDDGASLKKWFDSSVSPHLSDLDRGRAEAMDPAGDDVPPGEIDLFKHHLTRKRNVLMQTGPVRAFHATSALGEIIKAYSLDHPILRKLR